MARDNVWLGDELETGWYRDPEIELGSLFLELIALALPVQPLCRDDCPGLCPACGAELAAGSCGCVKKTSASPFAVLTKLQSPHPDTADHDEGES